jgi:hypothetical protein
MKGIMETAEALAAAARYDFASAALHSSAASVFFTVAAIAGGVGVGLAVGSRFVGNGKKGGTSATSGSAGASPGGSPSSASNQPLTPYSRTGPDAFISGRRPDQQIATLAAAVDGLSHKISSMPADHVVTIAAKKNPETFGKAVVTSMGRNSSIGKQMAIRQGQR